MFCLFFYDSVPTKAKFLRFSIGRPGRSCFYRKISVSNQWIGILCPLTKTVHHKSTYPGQQPARQNRYPPTKQFMANREIP